VISVHGGPGGESTVGYKPLVQYLVNNGYVVYEINNRGSSGSGRTFNHLDDHKHGDADLDDVVAAKGMLASVAGADPARIAIEGQSYGGFMVLAGLAFRPDAFAAGIDLYGVSNWVRLLPNTPPWWDDLRRLLASEMGDYRTEDAYLRSISPVFHADRIKKPLLVLQGANDPRVVPVESADIVEKARANGAPVQYVVFPDEGHGFRKKANQIVADETIKRFLDTYVKGSAKPRGDGTELGQ
jgi:dipeptidyl aminopeptidase/acylaminoacyl peptidase